MKRVIAVCGSRWKSNHSEPYEEALRAAGIEPVLVRPGDNIPLDAAGLLLMGGADVNPTLYKETRLRETDMADDARDALEFRLIAEYLERDLPLLAICRGMQMLNVQHGGTLVQHLETSHRHRVKAEDKSAPVHKVHVVEGTKLAAIVGEPAMVDVNSRHHQAVRNPGAQLIVSARDAEDGTIEAMERNDLRFVIAVQWHPENQAPRDPRQAAIFEAFAEAL
jgi:gamma-glutamyl-gamma-aminobutyrate hydrolase PuuD